MIEESVLVVSFVESNELHFREQAPQ